MAIQVLNPRYVVVPSCWPHSGRHYEVWEGDKRVLATDSLEEAEHVAGDVMDGGGDYFETWSLEVEVGLGVGLTCGDTRRDGYSLEMADEFYAAGMTPQEAIDAFRVTMAEAKS